MRIHNAIAAIDSVWAIESEYAKNALSTLEVMDDAGVYNFDPESRAKQENDSGRSFEYVGGVAVIPITGVMTKGESSFQALFGGTSTQATRRKLRAALADPDVKSILLAIDSPGGSVMGLDDLAKDVALSAQSKPTIAFIEDMGCSAAYYVASQANAIFANKTAMVGSIGCLAVVADTTEAYANKGIKLHVVSTGAKKGEGTDGTPVTKSVLTDVQSKVDAFGSFFFEAVATGRHLSAGAVSKIATGEVWFAHDALKLGLIDGIQDIGNILNDLQSDKRLASTGISGETKTEQKTKMSEKTEASQETVEVNEGFWAKLKSFMASDKGSLESNTDVPKAEAQPDLIAIAMATANQALDAAANQLAIIEAKSFSANLLDDKRITAGEREAVELAFMAMVKADGGGTLQLFEGQLVKGEAFSNFEKVINARPRHKLYETIVDGADLNANETPEQAKAAESYRASLPQTK